MTLYVDSSALLKRYVSEPDTASAEALLLSDPELATARHASVEIRGALLRVLRGPDLRAARQTFARDWSLMKIVELDAAVCEKATEIAESTGVRTLDALHLGAAYQAGAGEIPFLTYDIRQARAARVLGWTVLGI